MLGIAAVLVSVCFVLPVHAAPLALEQLKASLRSERTLFARTMHVWVRKTEGAAVWLRKTEGDSRHHP